MISITKWTMSKNSGKQKDFYSELITDHFELGKKFYAKRNNFKVRFRIVLVFIGCIKRRQRLRSLGLI